MSESTGKKAQKKAPKKASSGQETKIELVTPKIREEGRSHRRSVYRLRPFSKGVLQPVGGTSEKERVKLHEKSFFGAPLSTEEDAAACQEVLDAKREQLDALTAQVHEANRRASEATRKMRKKNLRWCIFQSWA